MKLMKKITHKDLLTWFMQATRNEVFHVFEAEAREVEGSRNEREYIFVPGFADPSRRPLLVAHADTVHERGYDDAPCAVEWDGRIARAGNWKAGIGADDRAGCAILWLMRASGASLLVLDEEESGCIGARAASREIPDELARHTFALEIDRRGDQQAVFYDCAHPTFKSWLLRSLGGDWREETGTWSDVAVLGPATRLNVANLSAGYQDEHKRAEILILDAWERSLAAVKRLVGLSLAGRIPELPPPPDPVKKWQSKYGGKNSYWWWDPDKKLDKDNPFEGDEWRVEDAVWTCRNGVWVRKTDGKTVEEVQEEARKKKKEREAEWKRKKKEREQGTGKGAAKPAPSVKDLLSGGGRVELASGREVGELLACRDWNSLSGPDRTTSLTLAIDEGKRLALRKDVDDASDLLAAFMTFIVVEAWHSGDIGSDELGWWEHRLTFSRDDSDPRVRAFQAGAIRGIAEIKELEPPM